MGSQPGSMISAVFRREGVPYALDVWRTKDGLPQSSVLSMVQTRQGYLWLGTLKGLVRFDGHQFTVMDPGNTPGLPGTRIFTLFEDSRQELWVGTEASGVALIRDGEVLPLDFGRGSRDSRVVAICEDDSGAVWLLGADGQLARYRDGAFDIWTAVDRRSGSARSLVSRAGGSVWLGSDRTVLGVGSTLGKDRKELPLDIGRQVSGLEALGASTAGGFWVVAGQRVQLWGEEGMRRELGSYDAGGSTASVVCEDAEGWPVVGTLGAGVYWYGEEGSAVRLSREEGLSNDFVYSLLLDREKNLWIGTDGGGLVRAKRLDFDVLESSRGRVVQSVCSDPDGSIWMGFNGGGIEKWSGGQVERFGLRQGNLQLPDLSVRSVIVDGDGVVWAGTWSGLFQRMDGYFTRAAGWDRMPLVIHALHTGEDGRLWVGTSRGLVGREDGGWRLHGVEAGLTSGIVKAVADDGNGGLWVGTEGGGVCHFDGERFEAVGGDAVGVDGDISGLWVEEGGTLWVATAGGRLVRREGEVWTSYSLREGMESRSLSYLGGDGRGGLWVGSNTGVLRLGLESLREGGVEGGLAIRAYRLPDGLPTPECTEGSQPGLCVGGDGRLWFTTVEGLVSVDPAKLEVNPVPPAVVIESVEIEDVALRTNLLEMSWPETVVVPAGRERVEVHYTSLNLRSPDRAQFRYRMDGYESRWTEAGDGRVARYTKLPPGEYGFHLQASNEDGVWNEEGTRLAFVVLPPFWRTWWFLGGMTTCILAVGAGVVWYTATQRMRRQVERLRQQQALERERARIARDLHDQLGASLTQISLLGEMADADRDMPEEVSGYARQITQTSRETAKVLDEIVWAVNPSNDTLDGLMTYFCKNAQEYLTVAGVRVRLEVPTQLPEVILPPDVRHNFFLAAKEAVTNVVRHAQATEAKIRLEVGEGLMVLEVQDNGRGLGGMDPEKAARRNGLKNMRKRMEDIGGRFELESVGSGGAVVRLTAPRSAGGKVDWQS